MNIHISALVQILLLYLLMSVAYFGWGSIVVQVLGPMARQKNHSDITCIWTGWAFTLLLFQLVHFRFALTAFIVAPIFAIGIAFAIPHMVNVFHLQFHKRSTLVRHPWILILTLVMTSWIASRSMLTPMNYDSGLYHFNAIRWINSFPLVPGLGNLHGRLAFNHSFFTWVAALNFYPLFNHGRSIANSFLLLLTIATLFQFLLPVLKQPSLLTESHPFQYAPSLFVLPILAYFALFSDGLSSPSPDSASILLQLTMFVMFAKEIAGWIKGEDLDTQRTIGLIFLAATAITIKLSNLAFSAAILGICMVRIWRALTIRAAIRVLLLVVPAILVWVCRGYVLSGAPLYPSTIGYIAVEWAIPFEKVVDEANWVYSWARQPGPHWRDVLGKWDWFQPWMSEILQENQVGLVYPFVLSIIFGILTLILVFIYKSKGRPQWLVFVVLAPMLFGLIYWFFTAPDPRFAHALFFCLSLGSALILLNLVQPLLHKQLFIGALCIVFVVINFQLMDHIVENSYSIRDISISGWEAIKDRPLTRKETSSGLVVFIPKRTDQCWDAPLPCTPYYNADLELRIPGKLGAGFVVKASQKNADQPTEPNR